MTTTIKLCSGTGQFHSTENARNPQPYDTISLDEIVRKINQPDSVNKSLGQWVIFSTLLSRKFDEQRKNGKFHALWADIDEGGAPSDRLT